MFRLFKVSGTFVLSSRLGDRFFSFLLFFFVQIRSAKSADTSLATTSRVAMLNKVLSTVVRMLLQVCTNPH